MKREKTPTQQAVKVFEKVVTLRSKCRDEIAAAPKAIEAKYRAKEAALMAEVDPEVQRYLAGLLDAHYDEDDSESAIGHAARA